MNSRGGVVTEEARHGREREKEGGRETNYEYIGRAAAGNGSTSMSSSEKGRERERGSRW